jgi:predicted protein tyrosine phosphatase
VGPLDFETPEMNSAVASTIGVLKVLFVCTMNQWRSPTAEKIYARHPFLDCRSGGTSPRAKHRVGRNDLRWADLLVLMEDKHLDRLTAHFRDEIRFKEVHVLDLEDRYKFMDPELIAELQANLDDLFLVTS